MSNPDDTRISDEDSGEDHDPDPPNGESVDPAELDRQRRDRLEQNRISARESRKRKKTMIEELQRTVINLSKENKELNERNEFLRRELVEIGTKHPGLVPIQALMRGGALAASGGGEEEEAKLSGKSSVGEEAVSPNPQAAQQQQQLQSPQQQLQPHSSSSNCNNNFSNNFNNNISSRNSSNRDWLCPRLRMPSSSSKWRSCSKWCRCKLRLECCTLLSWGLWEWVAWVEWDSRWEGGMMGGRRSNSSRVREKTSLKNRREGGGQVLFV
ncbi:hypothetical protein HJC23_013388 [Cyclotella cryptica]|uniref:BZIP domain-containing protein n=1 Tax=Cyclotella cryptica TaxID=29204 RepID=A0ABD3PVF5_9STRA|eukprot:CCRYP_010957-RA/>CCRYP_010957-RA protein AED:0.16 eAED:0.16 QI:0/-1/0/1/-1/1/1/0/268